MSPLSPSTVRLPVEIEDALRAFEVRPYPEALAAFHPLARASGEAGELARLCLNLVREVTEDLGRSAPPPHFNLRRVLIGALGGLMSGQDAPLDDLDDVDDQLLLDDFSDAHTLHHPDGLKATLPPPPKRTVNVLEESSFPSLLGDPNDLSSFAHLDAPQLPNEALGDSLFNAGLLSHNSADNPIVAAPPQPATSDTEDDWDWDLGFSSQPNPTLSPPQAPPSAPPPASPASGPKPLALQPLHQPPKGTSSPAIEVPSEPRHLADLQPKSVDTSAPPPRPSAPQLAPLPLDLAPLDATPPPKFPASHAPLPPAAAAFHQPATRPRYTNPLTAAPPPAEPPSAALITRCRDHLTRGQALDAYRCLRDLLATPNAHDDPAITTLQQTVEQALKPQALRYLEPLSRVPSLRVAPQALIGRSDLDHRAGYLISQIDGVTPLDFLLDLNAMSRHDAALLLLKLSEGGVIAFDDQ